MSPFTLLIPIPILRLMRRDEVNAPEFTTLDHSTTVLIGRAQMPLVTYHQVQTGLFYLRDHLLGMIHRADHRFFGMYVAACIKRIHDMLEMETVR